MSNKRIALVDDELFKPFTFYGLGFSDIVVLSQLKLSTDRSSVSVSDGDGIYLIGKEAYDYFKEFNHLGVRGENAYDTSFLPRIGLHNGAFVKVAYKTAPTRAELNYFLSDEFTKKVHFDFSGVIVKSYQQAIPFLNYFSSYPGELGFDYETDGFATMPNFVITGASLATCTNGAFFDFEAIERTSTKDEWIKFQQEFGDLLEKSQNDLWAYNLQFEQMVTFRVFGKDIEINDSSVYNVIQGHHYKKYSLKYTANRVLGTNSWDDDFDKLNDILGAMYKDPDITQSNYQQSSYFSEIIKEYPDYKDEFIRLIDTYWGRSYRNIPGDILGKYCNLDAFYTLAIHLTLKDGYTNVCHQIYMDNARLGARLHSGGMYKNEEYRQKYYTECHRMMVYGMTYITTCLCKLKVDEFSEAMKVLQESGYGISKSEEVLLKRNELYKGDMKNIARTILLNNLDENSPTGMDDQKIINIYGLELYEAVSAGLSDAGVVYVDASIKRKKKPFDAIINRLLAVFNMPDQETAKKHYSKPEYEKVVGYYFYKSGYDGFLDIWKNQMPDIHHIPYTFNFKGEIYSIEQFHDYLNNNYYNCTSPVEYPKIYNFFTEKYQYPLAFLSTLTIHRKIYDGTFKKSPSEDFKEFMDNIQNQPKEVITTLTELLSNPSDDRMTYLMNGLDGFLKINDFWKYYTKDAEKVRSYGLPYSEDDFNDQFDFLAKFGVLQHIYKRYRKMFTTYVMGLFKGFDKKCHDTEVMVPDIIDEEDPRCTVTKMFPRYEINQKVSKRWSGPFHTIYSKSDIKRIVTSPKGYLMSYFDISAAEVRSLAFFSKDPKLCEMFLTGQDPYVWTAKNAFPNGDWSDPGYKKLWRTRFKSIMLGKMYLMSDQTLANNVGISIEEARNLTDILFSNFNVVKRFIDKQSNYPLHNNGRINTFLGDDLISPDWEGYLRGEKQAKGRVMRHGVNLSIQGVSACYLAAGFYNVHRVAKQNGMVIQPLIVVHDSSTMNFKAEYLPFINQFYVKNFREYLYEFCQTPYKFDTFIGTNYHDCALLENISYDEIKLSGTGVSICNILDKLDESGVKYELSKARADIEPIWETDPVTRFMKSDYGCCMMYDKNYTDVGIKFDASNVPYEFIAKLGLPEDGRI